MNNSTIRLQEVSRAVVRLLREVGCMRISELERRVSRQCSIRAGDLNQILCRLKDSNLIVLGGSLVRPTAGLTVSLESK